MTDLIAFIRAQLDDDERVALAAQAETPGRWHANSEGALYSDDTGGNGYFATGPWDTGIADEVAEHIVRNEPMSRLAEIEAKRRILDAITVRLNPAGDDGGWTSIEFETGGLADETVRLLAQPYADRPGYREEWRP